MDNFEVFTRPRRSGSRDAPPTISVKSNKRALVFNNAARDLLGSEVVAVQMLHDLATGTFAIRAAPPAGPNAYKVARSSSQSQATIACALFIRSMGFDAKEKFALERRDDLFVWTKGGA